MATSIAIAGHLAILPDNPGPLVTHSQPLVTQCREGCIVYSNMKVEGNFIDPRQQESVIKQDMYSRSSALRSRNMPGQEEVSVRMITHVNPHPNTQ